MPTPKEYKHIRAWGLMMGSFEYYIRAQQHTAAEENAPLDAIYKRHEDEQWARYSECFNDQTREQVDYYLRQMKG